MDLLFNPDMLRKLVGLLSLTGFLRFGIEGASTGSMGGDISGCTSCHPSSSATFSGGVVVLTIDYSFM